MTNKKKPKIEIPKDQYTSSFPKRLLAAFLKVLNEKKPEEFLFRETMVGKTIIMDPAWSKEFFTRKVPLNLVGDPELLKEITEDMTMEKKKSLFSKAIKNVAGYKMVNLDRVTKVKKHLIMQGNAIDSNSRTGYTLFHKKK